MNFGNLLSAFDALMAFRDAARRLKGGGPPAEEQAVTQSTAVSTLSGQIESRLTNVVVAAVRPVPDTVSVGCPAVVSR